LLAVTILANFDFIRKRACFASLDKRDRLLLTVPIMKKTKAYLWIPKMVFGLTILGVFLIPGNSLAQDSPSRRLSQKKAS
jgi:hypothetical protein